MNFWVIFFYIVDLIIAGVVCSVFIHVFHFDTDYTTIVATLALFNTARLKYGDR